MSRNHKNNNNTQRNIFKEHSYTPHPVIKKKIPEIHINNESFPELSTTKIKVPISDTQSNMDFMVTLNKTVEIQETSGFNEGYIKIHYDNNHHIIIETSTIQTVKHIQNNTEPINFKSIINNWDNYYTLYNEIYGEDIYEKTYLFPNYNYNYFDMLDEEYYVDLETNETQNEYDDCIDNDYFDLI